MIRPCLSERLLMGRKESNQTKQNIVEFQIPGINTFSNNTSH